MKFLNATYPIVDVPVQFVVYAVAAVVVVRFGLIALAVGIFTANILLSAPLTTNFSMWYSGSTLVAMLFVAALAIWSFHTALAGRPLFKQDLFE